MNPEEMRWKARVAISLCCSSSVHNFVHTPHISLAI